MDRLSRIIHIAGDSLEKISWPRVIIRCIALCIFAWCLVMGRLAAEELDALALDRLRVLDLGYSLTPQAGADMRELELQEEHPVSFALWGQESGSSARSPELGRSGGCDIIRAWGDTGLIYRSSAPLVEGDYEGCLIARDLAMELFGSYSPVGGLVRVSGGDYTVRGIIESPQPVVMLLSEARESNLSRLSFRLPEGDPPDMAAEEFLRRQGLYGSVSQPGRWAGAVRALAMLPAAGLLLGVMWRYLKRAFAPGTPRWEFWLCITLTGAAWFLMLYVTGFRLRLPEELIPNRWSDFDFWARLLEEKRREFTAFLAREKTTQELELMLAAARAGAYGIPGGIIGLALARGRGLGKSPRYTGQHSGWGE